MLNIEEVKKEYYRIEKLLKQEALNQSRYDANCKKGYSAYWIKKTLGLTYNGMKKIIGAKLASTLHNGGKKQAKKKIYCARGEGGMINIDKCVVGCNPNICDPCPDKQMQNIKASDDTLTYEQEKLMRHGLKGMDYISMISPHAEI